MLSLGCCYNITCRLDLMSEVSVYELFGAKNPLVGVIRDFFEDLFNSQACCSFVSHLLST